MKTVLYFQPSICESNQRQLAGVYAFARKAGWNVQVVEYDAKSSENRPDIGALYSFWHPDGCIVDCGGQVHAFSATCGQFLISRLPGSVFASWAGAQGLLMSPYMAKSMREHGLRPADLISGDLSAKSPQCKRWGR